jgi:putative RNA 2'-phosphotransferase
MLKECKEHSYFRGTECPVCGSAGKFLMNEEELDQVGRIMAGVMRHFPEKFDLKMNEHGWIDVREFISAVQTKRQSLHWLRPHYIEAIVDTDDKGRYQLEDGKIRATYGHTVNISLDLPTDNIPDELFYPTTTEEVEIVLETGIKPADRKKVHLSKTYEKALEAGTRRVENPVVLKINAKEAIKDNIVIMQAGKSVYLVDEIPPKHLSVVEDEESEEEIEEEEDEKEEIREEPSEIKEEIIDDSIENEKNAEELEEETK